MTPRACSSGRAVCGAGRARSTSTRRDFDSPVPASAMVSARGRRRSLAKNGCASELINSPREGRRPPSPALTLTGHARSRDRIKRGGGLQQVSLDEALTITADHTAELLNLDEALTTLAKLDERQSQIVELRFFAGLTETEIANVLKVSERTVQNDWRQARSWLLRELSREERDDA